MKRFALVVLLMFGCRPIEPEDDAKEYANALRQGLTKPLYASCVVANVGGVSRYSCDVIMADGTTVKTICGWNNRGCTQR